jgi:hypothetical protein
VAGPFPSSYASGGTALGELVQTAVVGLAFVDRLYTRQDTAANWRYARRMGANALLSVILVERTAAVIDLLFPQMVVNSQTISPAAQSDWKPGHILPDAAFTELLWRPNDAAADYMLMEKALVVEIGPVMFGGNVMQLEATEIVVAGFVDPDSSPAITVPFWLGKPADFPSLP